MSPSEVMQAASSQNSHPAPYTSAEPSVVGIIFAGLIIGVLLFAILKAK